MWLGTMSFETKEIAKASIKASVEAGYQGVDTAWIYGSKGVVGEALEELSTEGIEPKIQTKIWTADFGKDIKAVFLEHLKEIKQEGKVIYSLLLHRPSENFDESVHAWKGLIALKEEGLVEHIGVSNFDEAMLDILIAETGVTPEFNQIELSVSNWRGDRVKVNNEKGIRIQGWSPLGKDIAMLFANPIVKEVAAAHNVHEGIVLLSFLTSQNIDPVAGSTKPQRVLDNNKTVKLTEEEIAKLMTLNTFTHKFSDSFPRRR